MDTAEREPDSSVTPIFGLTKADLLPVVENIAREDVASFEVVVEHEVEGHCGYQAEKAIPTFRYVTASGHSGETTAFAKRFHDPGPREAHHYAHLAEHRAPVARLYAALTGLDEREIIFLEFLTRTGDLHPFRSFVSDADSFRQFLSVAARLNAIQPSDDYSAVLYRQPAEDVRRWLENGAETLERIWARARTGEIGPLLQDLCAGARDQLPLLQRLAAGLVAPVSQMEAGLVHGDFYPDSTVWREEGRELVLVDLESVRLAPRFSDVARWIGASDEVQPRCLPRDELGRHYLQEYARWGAQPVPLDEFLEEAHILALHDALKMLPFDFGRSLDGQVDWTDDRDEGRRVFREEVHRQLSVLLHEVS